jgi:phosphoribosylformimino-5-aminoimidazole carboxamide ribotide isomerase
MRVIGVIDLRGGRAVHARAGRRDRYQPVTAVAGTAIRSGDAVALARVYVERLQITELYTADLDALAGGPPQDALVAAIAAIGVPLMLDAGVTSADRACRARAVGADRVVVALETLADFDALAGVCRAIGAGRVAFSLDLRNGQPILAGGSRIPAGAAPEAIAASAAEAGAGAVIVIDLARVGTGSGLDLDLLTRVRAATPGLTLLAGGGVRGVEDLVRLGDVGCDGALVATALHDGRLDAREIAATRGRTS